MLPPLSSATSAAPAAPLNSEDGPGTPTLDEQPAGAPPTNAPTSSSSSSSLLPQPTLNPLPLFEKLEKLEQAHQENIKKKSE